MVEDPIPEEVLASTALSQLNTDVKKATRYDQLIVVINRHARGDVEGRKRILNIVEGIFNGFIPKELAEMYLRRMYANLYRIVGNYADTLPPRFQLGLMQMKDCKGVEFPIKEILEVAYGKR